MLDNGQNFGLAYCPIQAACDQPCYQSEKRQTGNQIRCSMQYSEFEKLLEVTIKNI